MNEISPGIYLLPLPLAGFLEHINTYLVKGDHGHLLVDCGWDNEASLGVLKTQAARIGVRLEDITEIVVTHAHIDHIGLAARLKKLSGAKLAIHYKEQSQIESRYVHARDMSQQLDKWLTAHGAPEDERIEMRMNSGMGSFNIAQPDILLKGGEILKFGDIKLEVLWTPGHSPGDICLYDRQQQVLLSGDYLLPTITSNIGLFPDATNSPLDDYLGSLAKIKDLPIKLVLPGHEQPFAGVPRRVTEIMAHHDFRYAEVMAAVDATDRTAYEIATRITWMRDLGGVKWPQLGGADKRLAMLETLSHLESLQRGGKVKKTTREGKLHFARVI